MTFGRVTRASSLFVLATVLLAECGNAQQPSGLTSVKQAVNRLRQLPQWRHLDAQWADLVFNQTSNGPEVNVDVTVTSHDGIPLPGALVAIQESHQDLLTRYISQVWPAPIPTPNTIRAIAVTDSKGVWRFNSVRLTPPGVSA